MTQSISQQLSQIASLTNEAKIAFKSYVETNNLPYNSMSDKAKAFGLWQKSLKAEDVLSGSEPVNPDNNSAPSTPPAVENKENMEEDKKIDTIPTPSTTIDKKLAQKIIDAHASIVTTATAKFDAIQSAVDTLIEDGMLESSVREKSIAAMSKKLGYADVDAFVKGAFEKLTFDNKPATHELLVLAQLALTNDHDNFQRKIDTFMAENREEIRDMATLVEVIANRVKELYATSGYDCKFTISPINGKLELVNTAKHAKRAKSEGETKLASTGKRNNVVVSGISPVTAVLAGIEWTFESNNESWSILPTDTNKIPSHLVDKVAKLQLGSWDLNCENNPEQVNPQSLADRLIKLENPKSEVSFNHKFFKDSAVKSWRKPVDA